MIEGPNRVSLFGIVMVAALLAAVSILNPPRALAQDQQQRDEEAEALARILQSRDRADEPTAQPQTQPASRAEEPDLELKLSGNDVIIDLVGSDSIIIIGNEQDLDILEELIDRLDRQVGIKELRMHTLKNADANEVATKLQNILRELSTRERERPEERVAITALSSNILLIVAPPARMDQIIEIANAIDAVPVTIPAYEHMKFMIRFRKAAEVAEELKAIISKLQAKQGATAAQEIDIIPNDSDNSIMVIAPETERDKIQRLLDEIDIEPAEGYGHVKLVVFPVINTKATDLVSVLTEMLTSESATAGAEEQIRRLSVIKTDPDGRRIELEPLDLDKPLRIFADESTNSVIVATVEKNIGPIGEIVDLLDGYPIGHEMAMRVFPLTFADAETVLDVLKQLFEQGKELPQRAPGGEKTDAVPKGLVGEAFVYNVDLVADARTNTLIVSGRPEQLAVADVIVTQLDVPARSLKFPLQILFLGEHLDATRLSAIVEELFTRRIEALQSANAGKTAIAREGVFLAVDIRSNALIISASQENYDEIVEITETLNKASDRLIDNIRIINCYNTSAGDLASKIDELWKRKKNLLYRIEALST